MSLTSNISNKEKENELIADIRQVISFMKMSGIKARFFSFTVLLSLGVTLLSAYMVSLLFPLTDGIIKGSFDSVKDIKGLGYIVKQYPDIFSSSLRLFLLLVGWVYLIIAIKSLLRYTASISVFYQSKTATAKLRALLLDKCFAFSKSYYDKNKISVIHNTLTKSTEVIERQFRLFQNFIIEALLLIVYAGMMLFISWKLTLIAVLVFPIINFATRKIIKKIEVAVKSAETASLLFGDKVLSILYCIPVIKSFTKEQYEKDSFKNMSEDELERNLKIQKLKGLVDPIEEIGQTTATLMVALGMALMLFLDRSLNPTQVFVFFYLATKMMPGLNAINSFRIGIVSSSEQVKAVNRILEGNDSHILKDGGKKINTIKEGIEIKNLSFAFDPSKPIFNGIDLFIEKGKTLAIVGTTGSGKSTLTNLLLGFYDSPRGTIFIDGVDIKDIDIQSIRKRISHVGQETLLFPTSIEHNILYGAESEVSEEKIIDVGQKAAVHDFVSNLKNKYKTEITDRAGNLSGGEKQRIAIARALIKDFDVLIFDEATSATDALTESKIIQAVKEDAKDKTVIIITHRLSAIKHADSIAYLEGGVIKERGSFDELVGTGGGFGKLWAAQNK